MNADRKLVRLFLCCFLCQIAVVSRSQEVWTTCKFKLPLHKDLQVQPEAGARFRHDPSLESYAYLYRVGIKYEINNRWKLGSTFRITDDRGKAEISTAEIPDRKRFTFDIYADFPLKSDRSTIENRLRCQISETKKRNYKYYIRYRFGLQYRLKKNIYTTVMNEVYVEIPDLEIPLNKTSLEFEFRITKVFGVELFYTIESNLEQESPRFNYIIGCKLEISPFKR